MHKSLTTSPDAIEGQLIFRLLRPMYFDRERRSSERNLSKLAADVKSGEWLDQVHQAIEYLCLHRDWLPLLCDSGLWKESGFFREINYRVMNKLLPRALHEHDVTAVLRYWLEESDDWEWIDRMPDELWVKFFQKFAFSSANVADVMRKRIEQAIGVLSIRLSGMALESELELRLFEQPGALESFVAQSRMALSFQPELNHLVELSKTWSQCERYLRIVRQQTQQTGVSLQLTFALQRCHQILSRMRILARILERTFEHGDWTPVAGLFKQLAVAENQRFDLWQYCRDNLQVVAFQVTSYAGQVGEKYITSSKRELRDMFFSATKGGAVVAILCIIRLGISYLGLPPLLETLVVGFNYAIGFVCIHQWGGALATKQPAMTASTIAAAMDQGQTSEQSIAGLAELVTSAVRTQLWALAGNVVMVVPVALALSACLQWVGYPLLSSGKAAYVVYSNHPYFSLSFFYAAIAGVCLFLSGLISGWITNWFAYHSVNDRLRLSPLLQKFVGKRSMDQMVDFIQRNLSAWTGNVFLGFALAFVPLFGVLFGLPLQVRHVTFAAGSSALSLVLIPQEVNPTLIFEMFFGIVCIGLINLGVSFSLALSLAMVSRGISWAKLKSLFLKCWQHARNRPGAFFYVSR